jgi:predicted RNase H-like HicB family nuclease
MKPGDKYIKLVEWSEEDACFVGSCPELFYGGCHGPDARIVFDQLCNLVDETINQYLEDGKNLPQPMIASQLVSTLQDR